LEHFPRHYLQEIRDWNIFPGIISRRYETGTFSPALSPGDKRLEHFPRHYLQHSLSDTTFDPQSAQ